ncbi:hypothetical protein GCM10012276_33910 [Nocardioides deserti]|nr:hypothetical protein GCM10012276_33910 [Nocardioides deserti]
MHDVQGQDAGCRGEHGKHRAERQHLLAPGDETVLRPGHDDLLFVRGKFTQGATFTRVTGRPEEFVSNYNAVISTRHADVLQICQAEDACCGARPGADTPSRVPTPPAAAAPEDDRKPGYAARVGAGGARRRAGAPRRT